MKQHVHKYERRKLGSWKTKGPDVYKCAIPGCTHYMIDLEMVVGRYSQCWGIVGLSPEGYAIDCPNEVEMTRHMIFSEKRKRPLCDSCKEKRKLERETKKEEQEELKIRERMKAIERLLATEEENVKIHNEQ